MKFTPRKARSLQLLIKTLDRFGLMEPYLVTVETKPGASLDRYSDIIYDQPQKVYGIVIRIMTKDGVTKRITIDDDQSDEV